MGAPTYLPQVYEVAEVKVCFWQGLKQPVHLNMALNAPCCAV